MSLLLSSPSLAQTYYRLNATNDGQTINLSCPVSNSRFADDGSNSTHYSNNIDYSITFCAPAGKLIKFDFGCGSNLTIERIHSSDTLFIYDGNSTSSPLLYAVTGNPGNSNRLPYFDETSVFVFTSPGNCITFRLKSSATNNEDGWDACISCVDPISCSNSNNAPPSDLFGGAPYICNFNDYCGTTSADFGEDYPYNLNPSGGNCPSGSTFLGTIENNSWLKFIADSTDVIFDFYVPLGGSCLNGIQTAILSFDGTTLTRMSPCSLSDGSHSGNFQLTGSGLTVGDTYYLMIDGNAGDVCDYTINANVGVNILDAGLDETVCASDPVTLTATGPPGATYTWNSLDGLVTNQTGSSQTFYPIVNTTYVVEISAGACSNQSSDTVVVSMCNPLAVDLKYFSAICDDEYVELKWELNNNSDVIQYILEKANSNGIFMTLAVISPNQNQFYYSYNDYDLDSENTYYRLSTLDVNGEISVLKVIPFSNTCLGSFVSTKLFPNPTTSQTNLQLNLPQEGVVSIYLYDVVGRLVVLPIKENQIFEQGSHFFNIDVSPFSSGWYFLMIIVNQQQFILRLEKINTITN